MRGSRARRFRLAFLALVACSAVSAGGASGSLERGENRERVLELIERHQEETWKWQRVMQRPLTKTRNVAMRSPDPEFRLWALDWWRERAETARRQAKNPPYLGSWLCIHGHEGAWDDPNAPYYGGLQMDLSFQRTYGAELLRRKGTADRWSPLEQIWVAVKAHRSGRGFYPWPNTARYCGLI